LIVGELQGFRIGEISRLNTKFVNIELFIGICGIDAKASKNTQRLNLKEAPSPDLHQYSKLVDLASRKTRQPQLASETRTTKTLTTKPSKQQSWI